MANGRKLNRFLTFLLRFWVNGLNFGTDYSYDLNGNILNLERRKDDETYEDNFQGVNEPGYLYEQNTNKLSTVNELNPDGTSTSTYADYTYNDIGQLVWMKAWDDMTNAYKEYGYKYDVSGKVIEVRDSLVQEWIYRYKYDDRGFRIFKEKKYGSNSMFVRDASGGSDGHLR